MPPGLRIQVSNSGPSNPLVIALFGLDNVHFHYKCLILFSESKIQPALNKQSVGMLCACFNRICSYSYSDTLYHIAINCKKWIGL